MIEMYKFRHIVKVLIFLIIILACSGFNAFAEQGASDADASEPSEEYGYLVCDIWVSMHLDIYEIYPQMTTITGNTRYNEGLEINIRVNNRLKFAQPLSEIKVKGTDYFIFDFDFSDYKTGDIVLISINLIKNYFYKTCGIASVSYTNFYFKIKEQKKVDASNVSPLLSANPVSADIISNGIQYKIDAYNIKDDFYCTLWDFALILSKTDKCFTPFKEDLFGRVIVDYKFYPELVNTLIFYDRYAANKPIIPSSILIRILDDDKNIFSYNIGGINYFGIPEICEILDISVTSDELQNRIAIDTSKSFSSEPPRPSIKIGLKKIPIDKVRVTLKDINTDDLSPLGALTDLISLEIVYNSLLDDLTPLQSLTKLKSLKIRLSKNVTDISPIKSLTNLYRLDLYHNRINDLSALENLTGLTYLDLGFNDVADLTPLENLAGLTYLDLGYNDIADLTPLENLINLRHLDLSVNDVTDLKPLRNFKNLTYLNLDSNYYIKDISPLKRLTNLTYLNLSGNIITDVRPLGYLAKLKELDLQYNGIKDLTPLHGLTKLEKLNLYDNPVSPKQLQNLQKALPHCDINLFDPYW